MKKQLGLIRMVIATVIAVLLAIPSGIVSAQSQDFSPDSYTSSLSGFEITIAGSMFEITDANLEHYRNGVGEVINIESEYALIEVSFFDDDDTPDDSIDAYLGNLEANAESYTVVDRASKRDVYHAFAIFTYDDVEMSIYIQVTEDVVDNVDLFEMIITSTDDFLLDLGNAQEAILVGRSSFLEGVDGNALVAGISGSEDVSTPEVGGDSVTSTNPRDGARIGDGQVNTPDDDADSTPDIDTGDEGIPGVLTDSSWQGPIFEREIGWDADFWYVDLSRDGVVYSSQEDRVDSVTLYSDSWLVTPYVYIAILEDPSHSSADYLEYWSSEDYVSRVLMDGEESDYEVLSSRSRTDGVGVVIRYTIDGENYVRVNHMIDLGDGTYLMTQIDGLSDEIADIYGAAIQDMTLDGEELPTVLTPRQVDRAVGS